MPRNSFNMKLIFFLTLGFIIFSFCCSSQNLVSMIRPGEIWKDHAGQPINAHGGSILFYKGVYYWFGEIKSGRTWRVEGINSWEDYRVNAGGVSCYSSKDLLDWKFLGTALSPDRKDSSSDLHISKVIERPKVIFNKTTHQFVMWMHIDRQDYSYAKAGVAVSTSPEGPYHYLGSVSPNGQMSRDMTVFQDEDGKAYLIYSSENNKTMQVCLLSDDYLKPTSLYRRILIGASREAPAMIKYNAKYFLLTSLCTGWDPNAALYAVADKPLSEWKLVDNPCKGKDGDSTYHSQSTYIQLIVGKKNRYIFMADRWNKTNLEDSRYVWLPLYFTNGKPVIEWRKEWSPLQ